MASWNQGAEDQLVTMIQERSPLYDITDKLYSNRVAKTELWHEIEEKLDISAKQLKKRWESLRTQYTRYKKSSGAQRTGRQHWILTRLQFLEPHSKRKETTSKQAIRETLCASDSSSPSDPSPHTGMRTSTPEEPFLESEQRPRSPLAECSIFGAESTSIIDDPLPSTFSRISTQRPRKKRIKRSIDDSASDDVGKKSPFKKNTVVWHKGIAGRTVASAYVIALHQERDVWHVTYWVDNCSAQNKNWVLLTLLVKLVNNTTSNIQDITQKYFEPGLSLSRALTAFTMGWRNP
ncbi:hypothetical protein F2P79_003248 [Pimephales promelas]|nr:hypothetical protein F2P79_003248 [Pimephales promelas]